MVQEALKAGATKCLSKANYAPKQVTDEVRRALSQTSSPANEPPPLMEAPEPARPSPTASQSTPGSNSGSSNDPDAAFQASLRTSFIEGLPATLAVLRSLLRGLIRSKVETGRRKQIHELYWRIHAVTGNAWLADMGQIAQMSDALEALLKELYEKPENLTASALRTVASAIDFLGVLFEHGGVLDNLESLPPTLLVVDDESISRRAVTHALEKAKLKSISIADPAAAYDLLAENRFDLVFLDVDMPGMDGFDLCTKLRQLPAHKKTPVIFVTGLTDFESRTNSAISGGNDLIAKPFVFVELAVKALVCVLRARLPVAK
jgi:CheY-like chemotaxis protein